MHFDHSEPVVPLEPGKPWFKELNRFHWFVLVVAALGWLFDTMDQQLFTLARVPAMRALLPKDEAGQPDAKLVAKRSGDVTAIFLIGWATGGLIFGVMGDRYGRARIMAITILLYSACTGLSALSTGFWDFAFYRFLTGLGVGGEFAVGVSLVAEVMPPRARPYALGFVQALSAVGNVTAALISMALGHLEETGAVGDAWRWMFVVGALPALLVVVIRSGLQEPESWQQAVKEKLETGAKVTQVAGSYSELFGTPWLRRNAIIGLLLAFSGVVGLWAIVFFTVDLFDALIRPDLVASGLSPTEVNGRVAFWKGILSMMLNIGAFFGIYAFAPVSQRIGRRPTFALGFVAAGLSTAATFWFLNSYSQIFWLVPIMGFCILSLFGGYAVYLPELFPTRLRSTGTSFCYNVGRFVAASGPILLGQLTGQVFAASGPIMAYRYAGLTMCSIFVIGLLALPFAPETRNKPLPE
ncbi:MFS transporter [Planctomicrobium piriforme]|uniref:Predicted arabinose efflux permease, MFS family n=1 Tax=Planctomicrobium piriforme TaxID=1576369 RepID=A0A1I3IBY8_9PLAN|nr:MFS transporter [Planctomicrobium piriforme]SFI45367.1 Predicted arabinose efflux permease, MFS family [Planctomicrobium piriforme]